MEHQPWLDELRNEFIRRKLPPQYVRRLLAELSDHFNDFKEDRMSKDAADLECVVHQLGLPSDIGAAATAQYRRQRFSGRHPFLVFGVLPIVSLPMLFFGLVLGLACLLFLVLPEDMFVRDTQPAWAPWLFHLLICAFIVLPAIGLSLLLCRFARKAALGWKWPLVSCVILALLSASVFTTVRAKTADKPGVLVMGVGLPLPMRTASQLAQMLAPLAVGGWAIWRQRSGRSGPLIA